MTLFEYVAVAASLICSFVAVRLLGGIAAALRPGARYWLHAAWLFMMFGTLSVQWWFFWSYRDVDWTYSRFILALSPLALLYVLASLVVPADPMQVESWRVYFYEIRVRVFALTLGILAAMVTTTVVLLGHPLLHSRRVIPGAMALLFMTGMISDRPKVQEAIAIGFFVILAVVGLVFAGPSTFADSP